MSGPATRPLPPAWAGLIGAYLAAQAGAGRSPATIATRRGHLAFMARGLRCAPARVTTAGILAWFGRQAWSVETRRSHRNTAVSFFGWAHRAGYLPTDPAADLPVMRAAAPAPRPAPDAAWSAAMAGADSRVRLMLRLAAEAGLRRAEIARVHRRDLTRGPAGAELLVHGKGGKLRVVPVGDDLAAAIAGANTLSRAEGIGVTRGVHSTDTLPGYLFPGTDDGHLSPRWVGKLMAGALPDHWTAHTLRHRFATRAYRGSRNLRAVQTLLGHSSVATTERYTAVDDDEIRAAAMAALG
ncbi:tyrosine-type recombinase/integrase [Mycolicibacterium chlorophenolicum]|uniref:Tyrosine recombinase XerD n=1 Tax=Mycolicibacterium chlorophenolicum TaxID=37916 RepID=A0A0J6WI83_9MYCO|nr:tyrosine-type recombinase/integrase [Mycolicibacterium chlorophenolicum]KMO82294.1 Tyrosine recombinase XerD [Mycolicibacterium chlorophenolicum]